MYFHQVRSFPSPQATRAMAGQHSGRSWPIAAPGFYGQRDKAGVYGFRIFLATASLKSAAASVSNCLLAKSSSTHCHNSLRTLRANL